MDGNGAGRGRLTPTLYERGDEIARLQAGIRAAQEGRGSLQAIVGPAGIGKTALLQSACRSAREQDVTVLSARAGELERDFSFGVVRDLLVPAVRDRDAAGGLFAGAAALAATALGLPGAAPGDGALAGGAEIPGERRAALTYGLYWLTVNLAGAGPLLLTVDDAHWADPPSLLFLGYLVRRLDSVPILVVVSARSDEPAPDGALGALLAPPVATVIEPGPLSVVGAERLLDAVLPAAPSPELTRACRAATGGNPFLLRSLAEALRDDELWPGEDVAQRIGGVTPDSVRAVVSARIGRLSAPAAALARAVAILGAEATVPRAAALAGLERAEATESAAALIAAGVLADDVPLRFVHPLVAGAVYADMSAVERARRHGEAAALIAGAGGDPEIAASHLRRAEPAGDEQAVRILVAAAAAAMRRGAAEGAVASLRRALAEPPPAAQRMTVLRDLGIAEAQAAAPEAIEHLRQAVALAADPAERAPLRLALGRALMLGGRLADAVAELDIGVEEVRDVDPELELELQAELIGAARFDFATRAIVVERFEQLRARGSGPGRAQRKLQANLAFEMMWAAQPIPDVVAQSVSALGDGRLLAEEGAASPVSGLPLWALVYCDRYDLARPGIDALLAAARRQGSATGFTVASTLAAACAHRRGELAEAESHARAALDGVDAARIEQPLAVGALLEALVDQGRLAEASEILREAGLQGDVPQFPIFAAPLYGRARLRIALGALEDGLADAFGVGRLGQTWGNTNKTFFQWRATAALALHALGRGDSARTIAAEGVAVARAWPAPRAVGTELRAAGLVAVEPARRLEFLQESVAVLESSHVALEHARSLLALGGELRRTRHRREARQPLRRALDLADRLGAEPLAQQAREELAATGARPRRARVSGTEALTPSERRIAQMAADGMSNPEIAQSLFVTVKTVETHLSRVYLKLDISSRRQLAAVLAGTEPALAEPAPAAPAVAAPAVAEPNVAQPAVAEPEVAEPEVAEPEVAEPEVAEPKP